MTILLYDFPGRSGIAATPGSTRVRVCEDDHPPMLNDAPAALQCEIADVHSFGTHEVMMCTVRHIRLGQRPASLVYANRRYGTVQHIADEII